MSKFVLWTNNTGNSITVTDIVCESRGLNWGDSMTTVLKVNVLPQVGDTWVNNKGSLVIKVVKVNLVGKEITGQYQAIAITSKYSYVGDQLIMEFDTLNKHYSLHTRLGTKTLNSDDILPDQDDDAYTEGYCGSIAASDSIEPMKKDIVNPIHFSDHPETTEEIDKAWDILKDMCR